MADVILRMASVSTHPEVTTAHVNRDTNSRRIVKQIAKVNDTF